MGYTFLTTPAKSIPKAHTLEFYLFTKQMGEFKNPWWKFWAAASDPGVVPFLYACLCTPCANADIAAATNIGSDNWVFNCLCVPLPVTKMLYRKNKGHDGTCMGDCFAGVCCF